MTESARVLIVDDDELFATSIASYLCGCGYRARSERDRAALAGLADHVDLLVLGRPCGVTDTLALLKAVRAGTSVPIIMISSASALADRVTALDLGADDAMARPVIARELAARVACVLRRSRMRQPAPPAPEAPEVDAAAWFRFGDWRLDAESGRLVTSSGVPLDLPPAAARLLLAYLHNPRDPMIRQQLFGEIAPAVGAAAAPPPTLDELHTVGRASQRRSLSPASALAGVGSLQGIGRFFDSLRSGSV